MVKSSAATAAVPEPEVSKDHPVMPPMPKEFCLGNEAEWKDPKTAVYDPGHKECRACKKDYPHAAKACAERQVVANAMLAAAKVKKAAKPVAERKSRAGKPMQTVRIDELILKQTPIKAMVKALAADYDGDESAALSRINRHIKAIKDGTYVKAASLKDKLAYLSSPMPAPTKGK